MAISLIVPFHEGISYLEDCLASIRAQSLPDIETLLIADHTTEDLSALLEQYASTMIIKLYVPEEDRTGVAAARNLGIEYATGEYVYFLDSDDYLLENALSLLLTQMESGEYDVVNGVRDTTWHKRAGYLCEKQETGETLNLEPEKMEAILQSVSGRLFRRSFLEEHQIRFDESLTYYSDIPFMSMVMAHTRHVGLVRDSVYVKRFHNDPIHQPALDQRKDENRFMQYCEAYHKGLQVLTNKNVWVTALQHAFGAYLLQLYTKKFSMALAQSNSDFILASDVLRSFTSETWHTFSWEERRILKAIEDAKEKLTIRRSACYIVHHKFHVIAANQRQWYRILQKFCFQKMPMKENWIVFESFLGKNYSDSCKYIYQYLLEHEKDRYRYIWIINDKHTPIPGNPTKVKHNSLRYFYYLGRAKYWVNNMRQPVWMEKRPGNIMLQTWHGTPLKKLVFDMEDVHSALPTYKMDFYQQSRKWDYLISDNPFSTRVFQSAFLMDRDKIVECGYPRNDLLHAPDKEEKARGIRKRLGIPEEKKTILYAPTWRDDEYYAPGQYKFVLPLDLQRMREQLGSEYVILLRTHYFIADAIDTSHVSDFAINVSHYDDITELYLISDICITDYSSVFFDYANLRRPILFYTYDLEKYRDVLRGFYIDMERDVPGPLLFTQEEVTEAILNIDEVEEQYREQYDAFYDTYCSLDDGYAAKRIVEKVFH
ncbi:MAG: CDP-glycerol glycerophosphotransferase family protein [Lachnospiraceae bacterium]